MIYGYARVSSKGQAAHGNSLDDQRERLLAEGCTEIIVEQFTGTTTNRPQFLQLLDRLQEGDTLCVTKLDRLARNVMEGIEVVRGLFAQGVKVHVLNVGLLENTAMGNFFIQTLLAVAELERNMIVERVQAGKEIARTKAGFREGRPPVAPAKISHALQMLAEGNTYKEVSEITGISKSTLQRAKRKAEAERLASAE